ncbi:hypothetical protein DFH28DRAFT_408719 [Melampsora americana]|nr:hypothetical protein DFH28DRAFT_408719 [Melampsora americana]
MSFFARTYIFIALGLVTLVQFGEGKVCNLGYRAVPEAKIAYCKDSAGNFQFPLDKCSYKGDQGENTPRGLNCDKPYNKKSIACEIHDRPNLSARVYCMINIRSPKPKIVTCRDVTLPGTCQDGFGILVSRKI